MNEKILEKLWLSRDESCIYLFLLKHPLQTLTDISRETKLNRPKLYKIIPNMCQSWLISKTISGKRILYISENPEILKTYLHSLQQDFETFIPEVQKLYHNSFQKPILKHVQWFEGIKNIFLDIAHSCHYWEVFYRYSSRRDVTNTSIAEKDYNEYKKIRNQKKLQRYVITNEYLDNLKDKKLDKDVVVIPKKADIFEDNITKIIYTNKVAIIDYNTLQGFIIESEILAIFEKKLFMMLFQFLKKM